MSQRREIGPGSLLWHYAGDHRMAFTGLSAGLLQLMHPAIGAGVAGHSDFFNDPWDRIIRSVPQIMGVIYDPDPEAVGRRVRDRHRHINGRDDRGRPYLALAPDTFWWAHATFQHAVEQLADRFDAHRLRPDEREELYRDGVEWYRRYGVSMRPVPPDRAAFGHVWDRVVAEDLELNRAAERAIDLALHPRGNVKFLPGWTRPLQPFVVTPVLRLCAIGGLPAPVRRRFAIPWRPDEEVQYRMLQLAIRELCRNLPARLRYGPTATHGYQARRRLERDAQLLVENGAA
ncbi:MAG: oxygenase MpaB family protein [Actinomycetota bacterium]|nr:oxygenase MpaB family protein [Actinomycetota bacterium]